jgi:hypothetical protein
VFADELTVLDEGCRLVGSVYPWKMLDLGGAQSRLRRISKLRSIARLTDERTLALARSRFQAGYSDFIEVLDAQRQLLAAELAATQASGDRYIATATLFKALGGGWRGAEFKEPTMTTSFAKRVTRSRREASLSQHRGRAHDLAARHRDLS